MYDKKRSKVLLFFIAVFIAFIIFVLFVMPFLNKGRQRRQQKKCTAEAIGMVVSFDGKLVEDHVTEYGQTQTYYAPVIKFTAQDGKEYFAKSSSYHSSKNCRAGETVKVLYDPNDPTNIYLPDKDKGDLLSENLLFAVILIAGVVIYYIRR